MPRVNKKSKPTSPLAVAERGNDQVQEACKHEWIIETANGPISWGECQICHEGKEFKNSTPEKWLGGHRSL